MLPANNNDPPFLVNAQKIASLAWRHYARCKMEFLEEQTSGKKITMDRALDTYKKAEQLLSRAEKDAEQYRTIPTYILSSGC